MKLRPNVAAEQAVVVPCDTLVMESTFGDPLYRFPPDVATQARLYAAVDRALSDGPQAILPEMFEELMQEMRRLAPVVRRTV